MAVTPVPIPLAMGDLLRTTSYQPKSVLKNFYLEKDTSGAAPDKVMHVQRPGLAVYQNVASATQVRGLFYMQGVLGSVPVAVVGSTLYTFTGTTATSLGSVGDDGKKVQFAATNFGLAVLSNATLYFYDTSLHTVAIPNSDVPVSITSINSYVIVATITGKWYWIVPGDTTIDPTHFATAEFRPDNVLATLAIRDEVYMLGTESVEVWQTTGDATAIMVPAMGRTIEHGLMSRDSVAMFDNSFGWVGSDSVVYRTTGGEPQRISHNGIEERIRNRTAGALPNAFSYMFDGHEFYVLNVPGAGTYAYDVTTQAWSEYSSDQLGTGWLAQVCCRVGDKMLLGDSTSGKVFTLDETVSTDDGTPFTRALTGVVPFSNGRARNDAVEIWAGTSADLTLRLRWHDGPEGTYGSYWTATARAPDDIVRYTRLGAARQPFRIIEISTVDTGHLRISGAFANGGRAR